MKKILSIILLLNCAISLRGMAEEAPERVPALFSTGRLKLIYTNYLNALDRYKRCLFTSGCTAQEFDQVKQTLITAGKTITAISAAYFAYTKGLPAAKEYSQEKIAATRKALKETAEEISEAAVAKAMTTLDAKLEAFIKKYTSEQAKDIQGIINVAGAAGKKAIINLLKKEGTEPKDINEVAQELSKLAQSEGVKITGASAEKLKKSLRGLKVTWGLRGVEITTREPEEEELAPEQFEGSSIIPRSELEEPSPLLESLTSIPSRGSRRGVTSQQIGGSSSSPSAFTFLPFSSPEEPEVGRVEEL